MGWFKDWLTRFGQWLLEALLWVPQKLYELVTDALATVIENIPVPDFMTNLGSMVAGLDPAIAYFGGPLQLGTGLTWVFSALVLRFLIRRIPVIG